MSHLLAGIRAKAKRDPQVFGLAAQAKERTPLTSTMKLYIVFIAHTYTIL